MNAPKTEVTPDPLLQLGMGFWASKILLTAVELGVFTTLAGHPARADELTRALGLHPRSARDFFDALVALHVLEREGETYANGPAADAFLDRNKPSYVGGILEMANARLYGFWGALTPALKSGQPQNEARDATTPFDVLYRDPAKLRLFANAMTGISLGAAQALLAKFDWKRVHSFVDVGCAEGAVPLALVRAHPHLQGIGFDLPALQPLFEQHTAAAHERVRFQGGDFFRDPLPKAEVVIYGHMLHGWDLPTKKKLLQSAFAALAAGGHVIVYDEIIDDDRRKNAFGLMMSLNMLIETSGGFDYTGAECRQWLTEAGFRNIHQQPLVGPTSMIVAEK